MKKKIGKRISALVSMVLVLTMLVGSGNVWAKEKDNQDSLEDLRLQLISEYSYEEEIEIIDKYIALFENDDMFLGHYNENPTEALENVKSVIFDELEPVIIPFWYAGGVYGSNVPMIQQKEWYYCGVASALQVICSYNEQGAISGSSYDQKQVALANAMGGVGTGGALVYQVRDGINRYVGHRETYKYLNCTNIGIDSFKVKIIQSLRVDAPVVLHAKTEALGYYGGRVSRHYITVKAYNYNTGMVLLSDCNYNNSYYGEFLVPIQEVYNSVQPDNGNPRYIIYGG